MGNSEFSILPKDTPPYEQEVPGKPPTFWLVDDPLDHLTIRSVSVNFFSVCLFLLLYQSYKKVLSVK